MELQVHAHARMDIFPCYGAGIRSAMHDGAV